MGSVKRGSTAYCHQRERNRTKFLGSFALAACRRTGRVDAGQRRLRPGGALRVPAKSRARS
jgi:hypothetical protein